MERYSRQSVRPTRLWKDQLSCHMLHPWGNTPTRSSRIRNIPRWLCMCPTGQWSRCWLGRWHRVHIPWERRYCPCMVHKRQFHLLQSFLHHSTYRSRLHSLKSKSPFRNSNIHHWVHQQHLANCTSQARKGCTRRPPLRCTSHGRIMSIPWHLRWRTGQPSRWCILSAPTPW